MNSCQSDFLSQFYPVIRIDIQLFQSDDGVMVTERHRHATGGLNDCQTQVYRQLTPEEASDAVEALCAALLQPQALQG